MLSRPSADSALVERKWRAHKHQRVHDRERRGDPVDDLTVAEALADRLARLTVSGHLRTADPLLAADQFFALLSGPADKRARLGTRRTPDTELRAIAEAAVDTFLKAFGAKG